MKIIKSDEVILFNNLKVNMKDNIIVAVGMYKHLLKFNGEFYEWIEFPIINHFNIKPRQFKCVFDAVESMLYCGAEVHMFNDINELGIFLSKLN